MWIFCLFSLILYGLIGVDGHGKLIEPPARNGAWRYGFNTPVNNDDNSLYCGGQGILWGTNGGKCGACGDAWNGVRHHEAGGKYATGTIVRKYLTGQVIDIIVDLSAAHSGYFEFRLCPHDNIKVPVTQDCLNKHLLEFADKRGTQYFPGFNSGKHTMRLRLPHGLTCTQCVLQWKYNAGNSWGTDLVTGKSCTGCGPQEQFYNCADIGIGGTPSTSGKVTQKPLITKGPMVVTTVIMPGVGKYCKAIGAYAGLSAMDNWCIKNCNVGNCPNFICKCA